MTENERYERKITLHFKGGPWDGQTCEAERVVGPLFAVGHPIGNHYWLDSKSDPPTYHWDVSSNEVFPDTENTASGENNSPHNSEGVDDVPAQDAAAVRPVAGTPREPWEFFDGD